MKVRRWTARERRERPVEAAAWAAKYAAAAEAAGVPMSEPHEEPLEPIGEVLTGVERTELAGLLLALRPRSLFNTDAEHLGACLAVVLQGHVAIGRWKGRFGAQVK